MTSSVEIPNIVNTNSIRFAEIFKNRRNVIASMVFKGYVNFAMEISKHFEYKSNKICWNFEVLERRLLQVLFLHLNPSRHQTLLF